MQVFLDDFNVFGKKEPHFRQLQKYLENRQLNGINPHLEKCVLCVNLGVFLRHIVCSEGLLIDPKSCNHHQCMLTPTYVT